jgi:hypothetical protein
MSNFRNYINTFVFDTVLPGSGLEVHFKPVTTGQIKRLLLYETSEDPLSIEQALDDLIEECVIKPENFNIKDLYIQDRFFLLVEIRKATRGATYNFQTVCTSCGSQTQQAINLTNLPVTKLNNIISKSKQKTVVKPTPSQAKPKKKIVMVGETVEDNIIEEPIINIPDNEWDVVKINDNISVRLNLVTRNIQQEAFNYFKQKHEDINKVSEIEKTLDVTTTLYALCIKGVITPEGEETDLPLEERIFLLDNIKQEEQEEISKWFDKNNFGIEFSFDAKCLHCGHTEKKEVPVENFFY